MPKNNTHARLDKILPIIQDPRFRESRGLSNEIAFFIFDYPPEDELIVREHVEFLLKTLGSPESQVNAIKIDLYDLILDIVKGRKILDRIPPDEEKVGFAAVMKRLKPLLKPESFIEQIRKAVSDETNLVFLTGVGNAYPLLRSHTVLNNLHHVLKDVPLIMFFPGVYDQTELRLFGKFKDDNYYRAFSLVEV